MVAGLVAGCLLLLVLPAALSRRLLGLVWRWLTVLLTPPTMESAACRSRLDEELEYSEGCVVLVVLLTALCCISQVVVTSRWYRHCGLVSCVNCTHGSS